MKVLDLFSGIGGFSLGLERAGMETVAFCEIEPFPRKVLAKHWPGVPIYEDIRQLDGDQFRGSIDLVCGGVPCQPASCAGKRMGDSDDRWLWPETFEIIRSVRPRWVLLENPTGFLTLQRGMVFSNFVSSLGAIGYGVESFVIPACAVAAPHKRARTWIIAHTERNEQPREKSCGGQARRVGREFQSFQRDRDWESALREFRRVDDGLSYGVDRLDGLRNAVVPQIPEIIGRAIMEVESAKR